ncbi:aerolysin family beta-barrel pore-forming toxin [Dolichospermum sp. ST_sed3]|nr:aerolysin family beta-barrel pore-forming toxin [Dolichospermum sp. ST_sed3]MDD1458198.1 aerolysin family beta-barrel pore-forming toxin [Dolichospermum sp. ST_sed7]
MGFKFKLDSGTEISNEWNMELSASASQGWTNSKTTTKTITNTAAYTAPLPSRTERTVSLLALQTSSSVDYTSVAQVSFDISYSGFLSAGANAREDATTDRPVVTVNLNTDQLAGINSADLSNVTDNTGKRYDPNKFNSIYANYAQNVFKAGISTPVSGTFTGVGGTSVTAQALPDKPLDGTLSAVLEDITNPIGSSLSTLFSQPITSVSVLSNPNNTAQGVWQFQNAGNWQNISTGQNISGNDVVRFLPAANYNGTPDKLKVNFAFIDRWIGAGITAVNDAPVLTSGQVNNINITGNSNLTSLGLTGLSYSPGGGSDEATQTLTYTVTATPNSSVGSIVLADGTTAVTTSSTYTLQQLQGVQFKRAGNSGGTGNFVFTVKDSGGNANGGVDNLNQSLTITVANNFIGGDGNDFITGDSGNDTPDNAGNNILDGGAGRDTLIGGLGNDTYIVDTTTDTIIENANEGTDTIQSSVTFSLANLPNIENLTLTGTGLINGTGNAANNVITGNSANNTLNGGAGTDTLIGGTGNDIYVVDSTTDTITENASGGTDTIQSSVTYTIAALANVENLTLTGTTAINGTGNAANNIITGNSANNILNGGLGNDTLNGSTGIDTLIGGTGNDVFVVDTTTDTITENVGAGTDTIQSTVTFTLATLPNIENLTLTGTAVINGTGNAGNNVITGNSANNILDGGAGNDILNGGLGIDTLIGGTGNDTYVVDTTTDVITENVGEGTDTIQSSVIFTLATLTNIENLTLTGTTAINGTGNAGNNVITGNTANNILNGGLGNDILNGGLGIDTLIGGTGIDRFDYRTLANSVFNSVDVITDFNANVSNDLFLVATARSVFSNAGTVATFDITGITANLTTVNFGANAAAQFSFGSRTFVAINNATAGFSSTTDAIVEVTGLTGTLGLNNFTTTLV